MRWIIGLLMMSCCAILVAGCKEGDAVDGKVVITSTAAFGKTKAMKSPPPVKPG